MTIGKDVERSFMAYLMVLSRYSPGETKENLTEIRT